MFRAEVDKLEETMQEGVMAIITSWAEQEARSFMLRLLARKVGDLLQLVRLQINTLATTQLESLGEALLDFSNLSNSEVWLAEQGQ